MWELITEIVKKENGGRSTDDLKVDLYTSLLEQAGASTIYCEIDAKDIQKFQMMFRATRIIGLNESNMKIKIIAYIGTSQMDTKEMSDFIDHVLDYASHVGIYTPYWEELLK